MLSSQFVDSVVQSSNAQKISVERQKAMTISQVDFRPPSQELKDDASVVSSSSSVENVEDYKPDLVVKKSSQPIKLDEQVSNKSEKDETKNFVAHSEK